MGSGQWSMVKTLIPNSDTEEDDPVGRLYLIPNF
jgi:hypothetical protein